MTELETMIRAESYIRKMADGSRTHIQWLYHRIYQLHVVYCVVQLAMLLAEIVHSISNFLCIFFHCRAKNMLVNLFNHSCT